MEKKNNELKGACQDSSAKLDITEETKEAFKNSRDNEARQYIVSLQNWREQSLKCSVIF